MTDLQGWNNRRFRSSFSSFVHLLFISFVKTSLSVFACLFKAQYHLHLFFVRMPVCFFHMSITYIVCQTSCLVYSFIYQQSFLSGSCLNSYVLSEQFQNISIICGSVDLYYVHIMIKKYMVILSMIGFLICLSVRRSFCVFVLCLYEYLL